MLFLHKAAFFNVNLSYLSKKKKSFSLNLFSSFKWGGDYVGSLRIKHNNRFFDEFLMDS